MTQENQFINALKNPDTQETAFNKLLSDYKERLYWHVRKIVIDHNDADDVLQNTFLKVFENINNFKGNSSIYTWMFRIATNESLNYINKNFVHPVIANFKGMLRQEDFIKVDIIQSINLEGGEIIGIKKTMWLRIFQKIYKKRFLQQKQRIMLRKRPSSQHYRKLTGKYPK